jgi:NADP-dependent aldehyde dehydrogenase
VRAGVADLVAAGATIVGACGGDGTGWTAPAVVLAAPTTAFTRGSRLVEECFGPVVLVVEYEGRQDLDAVLSFLSGSLAASIFVGEGSDPDAPHLLDRLGRRAGRVIVDGWPTGVATGWAQHHGGPWPATSNPSATSVGAVAVRRFTRPVAYQGVPDSLLPPPLQSANPWCLPRRIDGVLAPASPFSGVPA